jgi:hypothetical protein
LKQVSAGIDLGKMGKGVGNMLKGSAEAVVGFALIDTDMLLEGNGYVEGGAQQIVAELTEDVK